MLKALEIHTYEDYAALPGEERCELIEGQFFMTPAPGFFHQTVAGQIYHLLRQHLEGSKKWIAPLTPIDVICSPHDVFQPDIVLIAARRKGIISERGLTGAPDLAVEVLSPSSHERDLLVKKKLYARYGVKEYWIVDPVAKTIEVLIPGGAVYHTLAVYEEADSLASRLLPGFSPKLRKIFHKPY